MAIACIGWGSLCWDHRGLPVGDWRPDGPVLPLEFARRSQNGRVTLVITPEGPDLQCLWAEISASTLDEAVKLLGVREDCPVKRIGRWPGSDPVFPFAARIGAWAQERGLSGAVWTALPPKWDNRDDVVPTLKQLEAYVDGLDAPTLARAREYVERAPPQIATRYRAELRAMMSRSS